MTSINTNIAAQTALRTLQATNSQLDATQGRISTGLKIAEAKDNAAYWSIATTLRSDNKALGTVKDALALGAGTIDTAYQGLNFVLGTLDELKTKLTAATSGTADRTAIQAEISELQKQLSATIEASTFSGENWLSADSSITKEIVSAFTRNAEGNVSLGMIEVSLGDIALVDGEAGGILRADMGKEAASAVVIPDAGLEYVAADPDADPDPIAATETTFTLKVGTADAVTLVIDKAAVDAAGLEDSTITSEADLAKVINLLIADSELKGKISASATADGLAFKANEAIVVGESTGTATLTIDGVLADANTDGSFDVLTFTIDGKSAEEIQSFLNALSKAADGVTTGAAKLGAISSRIELQQTFVSNLMDTIDQGISGLVDADMNEESTRLQALQVKQQLGVQALSIANQSAQNVLSLFR